MTNAARCLKLVFCGTPQFAVPTLEALLAADHEIALVVSQPDRPVGRDQQLTARPSSRPLWPPALPSRSRKKSATTRSFARSLKPSRPTPLSWWPTAASFRRGCWRCRGLGCINLHASLLPKYRGAAPIQWAIAMGDAFTGNTTMLLEEGLDTGPILLQQTHRDRARSNRGRSVSCAGQCGRAAGRRNPGRTRRRNDSAAAAESRRRHLRAAARPRRRPHGLCRAHGARTLQPLARLSALARRLHRSQWQEADRASHGGCAREFR